jgi:hypothetical protein
METDFDMSSIEIEQDAMETEYGEEIMNAGWNPAVETFRDLLQLPTDEQMAMAAKLPEMETLKDVSTAISEIFLRKLYSYKR